MFTGDGGKGPNFSLLHGEKTVQRFFYRLLADEGGADISPRDHMLTKAEKGRVGVTFGAPHRPCSGIVRVKGGEPELRFPLEAGDVLVP